MDPTLKDWPQPPIRFEHLRTVLELLGPDAAGRVARLGVGAGELDNGTLAPRKR
jgi:hypothetical protein